MSGILTKDGWLIGQQCLRMAWYASHTKPTPPDEAARFRMQQGQELHARARELFPGGVYLPGGDSSAAAAATQERLREGATATFFEATALAPPFVARADILTQHNGGWHLLEVKPSFPDSEKISDLVDDLSYTAMTFQRAGLPVSEASLVLLNRNSRFGDNTARLFEIVEKTGDVHDRVAEWMPRSDASANIVLGDTPPLPKLSSACRDCLAFGECLGRGLAHTVLELPSLHSTKLKRLAADGIVDLALVPESLGLNDKQLRVKQAALSEEPLWDRTNLGRELGTINWPCHYLDFETVNTFLPLYPGRGCHEQVLTQFSVHHRDTIRAALRHSEYLADPSRDSERELAERLLAALQPAGAVIVYNASFEKTRIKALQQRFADLAAPLDRILERIVDLLPIVRDHVYHPGFRGSFSIKSVLPALVPGVSYVDLDIADGDAAVTAFPRMARGEITGEAAEVVRRPLLAYCKRDTLAMVRVHDALSSMAS